MNWFTQLGARKTPEDPDGSRHHRGFLGFCTAMLVLIWLVVGITRADAAEVACRGPIAGTKVSVITGMTLTVSRWCTADGHRFVTRPAWTRTYAESPAWHFNKWFPNATQFGRATAPNGDRNVAYVARWSSAEFVSCFPPVPCMHSFPHGVRIWAWANGNYTIHETRTLPVVPLPRP